MQNLFMKYWIYRYFQLQQKIKNIDLRKIVLKEMFYAQTMQTYTTIDNGELRVSSFRVERHIPSMLDTLEKMDRYKGRLKMRLNHFNRFLDSLTDRECAELEEEYINCQYQVNPITTLERAVYDEIIEIEEAAAWMYGYPPETQEDINFSIKDDVIRQNFEDMLERLGI